MEGWNNLKLGEVLKLEYGKPLPTERRAANGAFPVYGSNGIKCRTDDVYWRKPSIVVGRKGSAGVLNLVDGGFWPLDVTYFVVFDESGYDLRFLYYLLSRLDLPSLAKGVKPGLNRNDVYAIWQYLPPLTGQKRIVAILDEAFAAIATATANTEKNLANARELFESELSRVFQNPKPTEDSGDVVVGGWTVKTLGELCEIARGGSPRPIKEFITNDTEGVNWIKIGDATASTKYIYKTKQKIKPEGINRSRMVHDGDFLLSNSMSFGRPYIMKTSGCIHDGWLVLSDKSGLFTQDYLYHFLGSNAAYRQFDSRASGSTVRNLNIDLVRSVEIPLPPLPVQKRIVAFLDKLSVAKQSLVGIYEKKISALSELKQSLLHKAFTGELTANPKASDRSLSEAGV